MRGEGNVRQFRVPDEQLDYKEDQIYFYQGNPFTGVGYEDVPGHGLSEITYRNGVQEGPARDWYPSGDLKCEEFYRNNALHGVSREFREDGSLISEKSYEYGIMVSSKVLDEEGKVIEDFVLTEQSPNFALLQRFREQHRE